MRLDLNPITYQGSVKQKGAYLSIQACPPISQWINCYWQLDVDVGAYIYRSVPDNCIDWIINLNDHADSFFVSPFSTALEFPISGPAAYFGIRFKLLPFLGFLPTPIGEWRQTLHSTPSHQLLNPLILEQVSYALSCATTSTLAERSTSVSNVLLNYLTVPHIDKRLENFVNSAFCSTKLDINSFGMTGRHLRRLSHLYFGLSIKEYLKVIRFQQTLHLMNTSNHSYTWLEHYYDQSHFIREFKKMSGASPKKFLSMSVLYNK